MTTKRNWPGPSPLPRPLTEPRAGSVAPEPAHSFLEVRKLENRELRMI